MMLASFNPQITILSSYQPTLVRNGSTSLWTWVCVSNFHDISRVDDFRATDFPLSLLIWSMYLIIDSALTLGTTRTRMMGVLLQTHLLKQKQYLYCLSTCIEILLQQWWIKWCRAERIWNQPHTHRHGIWKWQKQTWSNGPLSAALCPWGSAGWHWWHGHEA
jgi:hypothetical protein